MVALTSTKQRAAHIAAVPPPGTRSCSRPRSRCRPEGEEPVRACSIGRPLQWMAAASARRSLPSTGRHAKTVHGTSSKCVVVLIPPGDLPWNCVRQLCAVVAHLFKWGSSNKQSEAVLVSSNVFSLQQTSRSRNGLEGVRQTDCKWRDLAYMTCMCV